MVESVNSSQGEKEQVKKKKRANRNLNRKLIKINFGCQLFLVNV